MNATDDSTLAAQAISSPDAFAVLFDRFYAPVFNYVRYRCDDDATADDVTARVFERLLQQLHRFDPEKGAFTSWLFTIARNMVNDAWRRNRSQKWISLDFIKNVSSTGQSLESDLIQAESESALLAAVSRLPSRERDLLGLKYAGGLTNREIARMTGLKESHVGVILYRAIRQLRSFLGDTP